jgi:hypothetical protein
LALGRLCGSTWFLLCSHIWVFVDIPPPQKLFMKFAVSVYEFVT